MAREARDLEEVFYGPHEAPAPSRHGRGKIAELLAQAQSEGIAELVWEVRTIDSGSTASEQVCHGFVKSSDDPEVFCNLLMQKCQERLPGEFSGQFRIMIKNRATAEHHGSYCRQIRAVPSSITTVDSGGATKVVVIREPDAVRPWVDMTIRLMGALGGFVNNAGELFKAMQPPQPTTNGGALLQMLAQATAAGGASPPMPTAPPPGAPPAITTSAAPPEGAPTWLASTPPPAAGTKESDGTDSTATGATPITKEQVAEWARTHPAEAREMVLAAMAAGAA